MLLYVVLLWMGDQLSYRLPKYLVKLKPKDFKQMFIPASKL